MSPVTDPLTLGLMTKFWDVGKVKTRLGVSIGMQRAASLHRLFVSHLSATLSRAADRNVLSVSPDPSVSRFERELKSWELEGNWDVMPQGDGNLGERIRRWFAHFLGDQPSRAILIGADCPTLEADLISEAGERLRTNDVVLGPAADGGYYLIGLRGPWGSTASRFEPLFRDIPWSTDQVLSHTRQRLDAAGLSYIELATREDVDTISELQNLRQSIATEGSAHGVLKTSIDRILADPSLYDPCPE